jgi:hypothetical protein
VRHVQRTLLRPNSRILGPSRCCKRANLKVAGAKLLRSRQAHHVSAGATSAPLLGRVSQLPARTPAWARDLAQPMAAGSAGRAAAFVTTSWLAVSRTGEDCLQPRGSLLQASRAARAGSALSCSTGCGP